MEKLDDQQKAVPPGCQAIIDLIEMGDRPTDVANIINDRNVDINWVHPETGLPLLHYAVGSDRLETVRVFLAWGAKIGPDAYGRWPSILALQCECGDEVCDLIEEAEAVYVHPEAHITEAQGLTVHRPKVTREVKSDGTVTHKVEGAGFGFVQEPTEKSLVNPDWVKIHPAKDDLVPRPSVQPPRKK
jgi:hypothetical protein